MLSGSFGRWRSSAAAVNLGKINHLFELMTLLSQFNGKFCLVLRKETVADRWPRNGRGLDL